MNHHAAIILSLNVSGSSKHCGLQVCTDRACRHAGSGRNNSARMVLTQCTLVKCGGIFHPDMASAQEHLMSSASAGVEMRGTNSVHMCIPPGLTCSSSDK